MEQCYSTMGIEELQAAYALEKDRYEAFVARGLQLNMARGVPCKEQLVLSHGLMDTLVTAQDYISDDVDARSYGMLDGLPCAKKFFGDLLGVSQDQVIVGGNSSLNMMYDAIMRSYCFGLSGCEPWSQQKEVKFIALVPGYDRHFAICEQFGITMIPVLLNQDGPDMDQVRELVKDPTVKGMWCVPKYSNPSGITYSDRVVREIAELRPAAKDFRVYWDNAYFVHDLFGEDHLLNIFDAMKEAGTENLVMAFASTSKISFPGSGVACMAASLSDIAYAKSLLTVQTICPDKTNQLRHVRFFKDMDGVREQMKKHAAIIRPKFEATLSILEREACGLSFIHWNRPNGGYFISLDVMPGTACRTIALAKAAGVQVTPAGSTWPYHRDPEDKNIRLAPTFPSVKDLQVAMELLCICFKLAALEKLIATREA